jgi:hypothetical protein
MTSTAPKILTLNIKTAVLAETMDILQHFVPLIPESQTIKKTPSVQTQGQELITFIECL